MAALFSTYVWADNKQTVTINGQSVNKTVTEITFNGDNLTLTYSDGTSEESDMSFVKLAFSYDTNPTGDVYKRQAMGCICTYASYFSRQTNLLKSALQISVIDTMVAILAGLMIFPAAFSVGVNPVSYTHLDVYKRQIYKCFFHCL